MSDIMLGQNNLRILYYRYKDSPYYTMALIALIISISIILFFRVIVPQVESWFSINNEVFATRERISTINHNITFMDSLDKGVLNTQVKVATSALPTEKDFGPIVNALSDAALQAGVSLDDFTFQIGDTSSASGQFNNTPQKDLSAIKLSVVLLGDVTGVERFLKEIDEQLPLAEILKVEGDIRSTTVTLHFYQKQFPKITFKDDQPLSALSDKYTLLIRQMSAWQPVSAPTDASESAVPLF